MARPLSDITKQVLADLAVKPYTSAEICQKHHLKQSAGRMLLKRLVESERAVVVEKILQTHCKKPVPLYSLKTKEWQ